MRKIVDYCYVARSSFDDFLWRVRQMLDDGWQPLGGISAGKGGELLQAMVKYEDDDAGA